MLGIIIFHHNVVIKTSKLRNSSCARYAIDSAAPELNWGSKGLPPPLLPSPLSPPLPDEVCVDIAVCDEEEVVDVFEVCVVVLVEVEDFSDVAEELETVVEKEDDDLLILVLVLVLLLTVLLVALDDVVDALPAVVCDPVEAVLLAVLLAVFDDVVVEIVA